MDFVNPTDYPTLRFSNLGAASGYESFQVSTAATTNSGTPLYVTSIPYNFNYHQPISYPNGNVYEGFGSNTRPALLGIGFPNMYMQHVYNTTAGPTKNVLINNTLIATASSAANIGSLSHYISAMAKTQVGDDPKGRYIGYIKELFIYKSIQTSGVRDVLTSNINNFYQIGNFPDYTSGFLADYPGAAAAYSVRQLEQYGYQVLCVVRRAVAPFDEQDIGFTAGGDLRRGGHRRLRGFRCDTLVVSRLVRPERVQSRHATFKITPGSQPQIYNGTAVITENGKPAVQFDGSDDTMITGLTPYIAYPPAEENTIVVTMNAASGQPILGDADPSQDFGFETNRYRLGGEANALLFPYTLNSQVLYFAYGNRANSIMAGYKNGSFTISRTTLSPTFSSSQNTYLGSYGGNRNFINAKAQEIIVYPSDKSGVRTAIETNIMTYSISMSTVYLPVEPMEGSTSNEHAIAIDEQCWNLYRPASIQSPNDITRQLFPISSA